MTRKIALWITGSLLLVVYGLGWLARWLLSIGPDIIGLPGFLDDAQIWYQSWFPKIATLLSWLGSHTQGWLLPSIGLFAIASIYITASLGEMIESQRTSQLSIGFMDGLGDLNYGTFHRTSFNIGVQGQPIGTYISGHIYRFGVKNNGVTTARCVRAFAINDQSSNNVWHRQLPHLTVGLAPIDTQPGAGEYFQLLEFRDHEPIGLGLIRRITPQEYEDLWMWREIGENWYGPMFVPAYNDGFTISRPKLPFMPEATELDVTVQADDLPPTFARFIFEPGKPLRVSVCDQGLRLRSVKKPRGQESKREGFGWPSTPS